MRIVSLLSSATEILYGLGLADSVLAVSHECGYPPEFATKPRVTFSHVDSAADSGQIDTQVKALLAAGQPLYGIDVELLVKLQPELIVTQAQCDVCAIRYQDVLDTIQRSAALRDTAVVALNPHSLGDVLADIYAIGAAAQRTTEAELLIASLQKRIDVVRRQTAALALAERPRTACLEWIEPPMLAANWTPELLDWAGGQCELTRAGRHSSYIGWNEIVQFDPQVLVVMPCGFNLVRSIQEARRLATWPDWRQLRAVRDAQVYVVDGNSLFNRSGPRLVDSLELLAHLLHPARCPAVSSAPQGVAWQRGF